MKNIIFVLFMVLSLFVFGCEFQDNQIFHLVYSVTSLNDQSIPIEITYKVDKEYITEQTQTPFICEQDIILDESKSENFYYFVQIISSEENCKQIHVEIFSNDESIQNIKNLPFPVIKLGGYIGFGLTSVNVN